MWVLCGGGTGTHVRDDVCLRPCPRSSSHGSPCSPGRGGGLENAGWGSHAWLEDGLSSDPLLSGRDL